MRAALDEVLARRLESRPGRLLKLNDLTVLSDGNDPFRMDTASRHRDAAWFANLIGDRVIHSRGAHYMAIGTIKPDGRAYVNTQKEWAWLSDASRAARWLGYVPFGQITDERNAAPVIQFPEQFDPWPTITIGEAQIVPPEHMVPLGKLGGWHATQKFQVAFFGEKTSLRPVLSPIATEIGASLFMPTGESSDTLIYALAENAHEDGRPLVILYFSDCDPSGHQMAISVAWKMRALQLLHFQDLEWQMIPSALTVAQVRDAPRDWGMTLPSSPLKDKEKRADNWRAAYGIEQTEIDSIATLAPDLLDRVVREAIAPWFDADLAQRMEKQRLAWEAEAEQAILDRLGPDVIAKLVADCESRLAELRESASELNAGLDPDGLDLAWLPPEPEPASAEVRGESGLPPLASSEWDLLVQTRVLKAHKGYRDTLDYLDGEW